MSGTAQVAPVDLAGTFWQPASNCQSRATRAVDGFGVSRQCIFFIWCIIHAIYYVHKGYSDDQNFHQMKNLVFKKIYISIIFYEI